MNIGSNISGEIMDALLANGLQPTCRHCEDFSEIHISSHAGQTDKVTFIVIDSFATNPEDAAKQSEHILSRLNSIRNNTTDNAGAETVNYGNTGTPNAGNTKNAESNSGKAMVIPADLWCRHREMTLGRMLAHCGIFTRIFARNCEVRRIRKPEADAFMNAAHSYGTAVCRNRYGLFTLRDTSQPNQYINTQNDADPTSNQFSDTQDKAVTNSSQNIPAGTLVAVAEFSNMRLIHEEKGDVRSYEWIRYASIPNLRVDGGMGKVLRKFIDDIHPGDVVSYADLEWSDGAVYRSLGFRQLGTRPPVLFSIDPDTMRRIPLTGSRKAPSDKPEPRLSESGQQISDSESSRPDSAPALYYRNFGSLRYRLLL